MDKDYLIQLTQNLYRLTLFFPKKEPLRYKMRELADDILADLTRPFKEKKLWSGDFPAILEDLEVLDGFFEVAKPQNWVTLVDLLRLQEEYNKIKTEIKIKKIIKQPPKGQTSAKFTEDRLWQTLNERQQKILEFLKENGQAQVWQAKQFFPEVTKRTLRRDFEFLLKQDIIERIGERNNIFYQLPTNYESKRITNTNKGRTMS